VLSNTNGIIGGWGDVDSTDWASNSGVRGQFSDANANIAPSQPTRTTLGADGQYHRHQRSNSTTNSGLATNSLRFADSSTADTVTLSSTSSANPNVIVSGGILVSSAVAGLDETIAAAI